MRLLCVLLVVLAAFAGSAIAIPASADLPGYMSPNAKVCRLLPLPQIEKVLGVSGAKLSGRDDPTLSQCTANYGKAASASLSYAKPGGVGLPTTADEMLILPKDAAAHGEQVVMQKFGGHACYAMRVGPEGISAWSTACGDPQGYLVLALSRRGGGMIPLKTVNDLLNAAKRKL